ncbi:hypothetical protein E308F_16660 [Moorella sp. E308F]|uniref:hypothetical protein n=1 Tax=unclassified Neomoorella TaxID=2676739 RepID=UPI0010FFB34A|nr:MULTISPECIES: hypothetical protein [unclassified Moorella (in: firmicutes)]GEA15422.1 hypothetical protein E308F_16660 [Moorella sp. E308F]GEA19718.1 hypothetical protein E306M_28570 [Moorella sp. E306M]
MKEECIFASLLRLPGVSRVNAVRSQGSVKHFNVTYVFPARWLDDGRLAALLRAWPFCNVAAGPDGGPASVEFLVRPNEADTFMARVGGTLAGLLAEGGYSGDTPDDATFILEFDATVPPECRDEMQAALRASDRIEWSGRSAAVTLAGCRDAAAAGKRLVAVAEKHGLKVRFAVRRAELRDGSAAADR